MPLSATTRPILFGSYMLLDRLRIGGMAEIWRALPRSSVAIGAPRVVALKRMLPTVAEDPDLAARFRREGEIARRLHHRNIVQAYELGAVGARPFLALEYLPGCSLREFIDRARATGEVAAAGGGDRSTEGFACFAVAALCRGLAHAHRRGIIHGDVSAENCLVGFDGAVKLVDFGLAETAARGSGVVVGVGSAKQGTPGYASPEAARGLPLDGRSDLYAAGAVLAQLLSARASRFATPQDPSRPSADDLHPALAAILEQSLALERDDRFPRAARMAEALERQARLRRFGRGDAAALVRGLFADAFAREQVFASQAIAAAAASSSIEESEPPEVVESPPASPFDCARCAGSAQGERPS